MIVLSIIVPVYNVEDYVLNCIKSITSQLDDRIEVIIVDDGSTDRSIDVIKDVCSLFHNIKIFHKENGGLSTARNFGFNEATGRYVYFADSDDFIAPNTIKGIVDILETSHSECFIFNYITLREFNVKKSYCLNSNPEFVYVPVVKYINKPKHNLTSAWRAIVLKEFLLKNQISFREGVFVEDIEWMTRIMLNLDSLILSGICLYIYNNTRDNSIMNTLSFKRIQDTFNNIYIAWELTNEIRGTQKSKLLKKKLFLEWYATLSQYSTLPVGIRKSVDIHESLTKDKESLWFRFTDFILRFISRDTLAGIIRRLLNLRLRILTSLRYKGNRKVLNDNSR